MGGIHSCLGLLEDRCIGPSMGHVLGMEPKGKRTTGSHTITKGGDEHLKQSREKEKEGIYLR